MHCEVCGRVIRGKPNRMIIEGAKMTVCSECAVLGSASWKPKPKTTQHLKPRRLSVHPAVRSRQKQSTPPVESTMEIVQDVGAKIRKAREKRRLNHEELGRMISEKVSVLKKIESGKMIPDFMLAAKLERTLKVKLLIPLSEPDTGKTTFSSQRKVTTFGDLVKLEEDGGG